MFDTVLPNCAAPLIVQATLGFSSAILDAAALGFLGLGAQPPTPEWGSMLASALEFIQSAWWVVTLPGLAILITVLAFNLTGDGLRDALDPKLKTMSSAPPSRSPSPLLEVERLHGRVRRAGRGAASRSSDVSFSVDAGEVVGIVGESGSGKSVTALAVLGLIDAPGRVRAERLAFDGRDLQSMSRARAPRAPRRRHRDDLPGPDDEPEPVVHASPSS